MSIGICVLGDQLWAEQAALASCEQQRNNTPVILIESLQYAQQRRYHRQKLVLIWSAMRHFADYSSPWKLLAQPKRLATKRSWI